MLPSFAAAKVSMRLVPDQDPNQVFDAYVKHVKSLAPQGGDRDGEETCTAPARGSRHRTTPCCRPRCARWRVPWTKKPALIREGGSIPVMATFQQTHDLPCILMGFGLHDDQVHAPNEKFSLTSFDGGTKSCAYLYEELAK